METKIYIFLVIIIFLLFAVPQSTGKKNADSVPVPKINNNELNSCVNNEISADFKKVDQSDVVFATTESNIQNKPSGASGSIFSQKIKDEDMEDLYSMATQKITHEAEIDNVERNLIALFSSPEKNQNNCGQNDTVVKESTIVNDVDNLLHHLHDTANTLSMLYKNNHNIDDLKLCIGKLKLIFNNFKTTKAPINHLENGMQECINSTTQTVAFDTKSIAIQTDDCDSSGFKISSTADFKTLIQCNAEVQTDFVVEHEPETSKSCGLEKETELTRETRTMTNGDRVYVTSDTNANNITSQGMSLNNNISPKSNKDNYQFTESMDNINFDTQAIFNQNKIKGLDNVNLKDENKIIHETNTQIQLHKQARKKLILCKPDELDSRNCINDNEIEIIEIGETVPLPIDSETTENEMKMKRNKEDLKEKATQRSTISFSLDLDKCNKNAFNSESIRKFKRVRALMEDSDSDDGFVKKNKKKENPYLNPNLSVEFVSQDTQKMNIETKAEQENSVNTMILSQSLNYDVS